MAKNTRRKMKQCLIKGYTKKRVTETEWQRERKRTQTDKEGETQRQQTERQQANGSHRESGGW